MEKVEEKESVSAFPSPTYIYTYIYTGEVTRIDGWHGGNGDGHQRRWLPLGGAKADAFPGFH